MDRAVGDAHAGVGRSLAHRHAAHLSQQVVEAAQTGAAPYHYDTLGELVLLDVGIAELRHDVGHYLVGTGMHVVVDLRVVHPVGAAALAGCGLRGQGVAAHFLYLLGALLGVV